MRANKRLLRGSPQRMRLLLAMSTSVMAVSSFTGTSPRNWRRHSRVAADMAVEVDWPIWSFMDWAVGRTKMKESMKASSIGPWRPWRFLNWSFEPPVPGLQRVLCFSKWAMKEPSEVGDGAGRSWLSRTIFEMSKGWPAKAGTPCEGEPARAGIPCNLNENVMAETLVVVAWIISGVTISASTRARVQC